MNKKVIQNVFLTPEELDLLEAWRTDDYLKIVDYSMKAGERVRQREMRKKQRTADIIPINKT